MLKHEFEDVLGFLVDDFDHKVTHDGVNFVSDILHFLQGLLVVGDIEGLEVEGVPLLALGAAAVAIIHNND